MSGPFTFPVAQSIPFEPNRNPGFGGGPSNLTSENCQDAIEEAKNSAFSNDRYPFVSSYGGNANVGRYLETFPSISMDQAPFTFPENSKIVTVVLGAVSTSTGTVGFFKTTDLVTPVFTLSLTAQTRMTFTSLAHVFNAGDELVIRVTSGSFNKPFMRVWVNTLT